MAKRKKKGKAEQKAATRKAGAKPSSAKAPGKKKGSPPPPPPGPKQFPNEKMKKLALHALNSPGGRFRKSASAAGRFNTVLDDEIKKGISGVKSMDPDERAYCEGWLLLARLEHDGKHFDEKLVIAIKEQLERPGTFVING